MAASLDPSRNDGVMTVVTQTASTASTSIVPLVTSIVALGLSTASITWSVAQFRLTGACVTVRLAAERALGSGFAALPVGKRSDMSAAFDHPTADGGEPVMVIIAHNKGRTPMEVSSLGIQLDNGFARTPSLQDPDSIRGSDFPCLLGTHSELTWEVRRAFIDQTSAFAQEAGVMSKPSTFRAWVRLSTEKVIWSDRVPLPNPAPKATPNHPS